MIIFSSKHVLFRIKDEHFALYLSSSYCLFMGIYNTKKTQNSWLGFGICITMLSNDVKFYLTQIYCCCPSLIECHFDKIFVTVTGSYHFDNCRCSHWQNFINMKDIFVSVLYVCKSVSDGCPSLTSRMALFLERQGTRWLHVCPPDQSVPPDGQSVSCFVSDKKYMHRLRFIIYEPPCNVNMN